MNYVFKVGDVGIGQNFVNDPTRNGMECEIIGGLEMRLSFTESRREFTRGLRYQVKWADGLTTDQEAYYLRPKRPPRHWLNEVVIWESVGWMPMDVKLDRAIKQALKDQVREKA